MKLNLKNRKALKARKAKMYADYQALVDKFYNTGELTKVEIKKRLAKKYKYQSAASVNTIIWEIENPTKAKSAKRQALRPV